MHGTKKTTFRCLLKALGYRILLSRIDTQFHRRGPATEKLLSARRVRVLGTSHVMALAECSDWQPISVNS